MLVHETQRRLVSIRGSLLRTLNSPVGCWGIWRRAVILTSNSASFLPGQWDLAFMEGDMEGKALLFKTIAVQEKEYRSGLFVVIDEAYHHYAGTSGMYASFIERPLDDERVIVVRTFSKVHGFAGLRLGYAVGSPQIIQRMRKFATEDNVNAIVTQAAAAALDDTDGVHDVVRRNANDRQEFLNQAMARALKPIDSHANFVMMNAFHPAGGDPAFPRE